MSAYESAVDNAKPYGRSGCQRAEHAEHNESEGIMAFRNAFKCAYPLLENWPKVGATLQAVGDNPDQLILGVKPRVLLHTSGACSTVMQSGANPGQRSNRAAWADPRG